MTGDGWLLRLDADGQVLWQKSLRRLDTRLGPLSNRDAGRWIRAGRHIQIVPRHPGARPPYSDDGDMWVFKVNASGEVVWENTYGGRGEDSAYTVRATGDGGYVVGGITRSIHVTTTESWGRKQDGRLGAETRCGG